MTKKTAISVAIIGSGPAGFYTANALLKLGDLSGIDYQIDILERLPTPFGLIRGGVAPDHQTTKRVALKFEKTAQNDQVQFFGNVELGRDVKLDELRKIYDAVVLAVGAPSDRKLNIPGIDKYGVFGSAAFVGWYNGHPDFTDLNPDLNTRSAVVIGAGNVAMDCARVLVRSSKAMIDTDEPDSVVNAIAHSPITDVYLTARRGPVDVKFSNTELKELEQLNLTVPLVHADQLPDHLPDHLSMLTDRDQRMAGKNLDVLKEYSRHSELEKHKHIRFEFFALPIEILGGDRVEGVRFERTQVVYGEAVPMGEFFDIPCGLVVTAIGYRSDAIDGAPYDEKRGIIPNQDGYIDEGLYAVGWIKRGPSGVISSNRPDGEIVAEFIANQITAKNKSGRSGFEALLNDRDIRFVTFDDWKTIDAAEHMNTDGQGPRRKYTRVKDMLGLLDRKKQIDNNAHSTESSSMTYKADLSAKQAWDMLSQHPESLLVDVRTDAEYAYVGLPDLRTLGREPHLIPWVLFPDMQENTNFQASIMQAAEDKNLPILFLCRSGVRSMYAAERMAGLGYTNCYNIEFGFEGMPDDGNHRGVVNGWKADGLPWIQN